MVVVVLEAGIPHAYVYNPLLIPAIEDSHSILLESWSDVLEHDWVKRTRYLEDDDEDKLVNLFSIVSELRYLDKTVYRDDYVV